LGQDIQNLALTIRRTPLIYVPAISRDEYLTEMPADVWRWMRTPELSGVDEAKLYRPDCFVGDIDTSFSPQVFDIPKA